jgi:subtilisin family serine protease
MAVTATPEAIAKLKKEKTVAKVTVDTPNFLTLNISTETIGATKLWANKITGFGTNVAIIDTGVDATHPMLSGKVLAQACFTVSGCPNRQSVQIGTGAAVPIATHGTHVASTAAGRQWTAPGGTILRGVAPDAGIIAIQVFQKNSSGGVFAYDSSILAALDWVAQQRATLPIAAVNMSLGGNLFSTKSSCDAANPSYVKVFAKLQSLGVAPVVATGNNGATGAMSSPACVTGAISVGAIGNDNLNQLTSYSNISSWKSLLAPGGCGPTTGRGITAAVPGNAVASMCGTSMATPHVAGAFALLRQQLPTATVADLLKRLQSTGSVVASSRNTGNARAIQVFAASPPPPTTTTTKPVVTTTTTKPVVTTTTTKPVVTTTTTIKPVTTTTTIKPVIVTTTTVAKTK